MLKEQDPSYYSVLNVSRDASDDDIKKAFRNLAQTYHPDKQSDTKLQAEAAASFTLLQESYEVRPHSITLFDAHVSSHDTEQDVAHWS